MSENSVVKSNQSRDNLSLKSEVIHLSSSDGIIMPLRAPYLCPVLLVLSPEFLARSLNPGNSPYENKFHRVLEATWTLVTLIGELLAEIII